MKDLKVLKLSIPTLDSSECKTLMGGDGYIWGGELSGVEVVGEKANPERPDYDRDDDNLDYGDDYDYDYDYNYNQDGNQDRDKDGFNLNNMLENAKPQAGNTCVFAAINAMLCGYGKTTGASWLGIAYKYAEDNKISIVDVMRGSFDGVSSEKMPGLLGQYFDGVSSVDKDGIQEALNDGPIYGVINPGDTDGNGKEDDGHAVVIYSYDENQGIVIYWDPETGKSGNGSVEDFMIGWSVNGVKE